MNSAVQDLPFRFRVGLTASDIAWESTSLDSTGPVGAESPTRVFVRRMDAAGAVVYAYFAGRTTWLDGTAHVCEGYLFEVSPRLRRVPDAYPTNGRDFRSVGEAIITDDPRVLESLRKAYR